MQDNQKHIAKFLYVSNSNGVNSNNSIKFTTIEMPYVSNSNGVNSN